MDRAANYFLMTEMMRGMYVLMEQFFRPPYVQPPLHPGFCVGKGTEFLTRDAATPSTILSKRFEQLWQSVTIVAGRESNESTGSHLPQIPR